MDSSVKILLVCFLSSETLASDLSLMLSKEEQAALTQAQEQAQTLISQDLRLDGIVYAHQASWTIWLNGRPLTCGQTVDSFHILKVTPESVEMIWKPAPDQSHQICLKPNEAFPQKNSSSPLIP